MPDDVPPQAPINYTQLARTIAEVARDLNQTRHLRGVWKNFSSGKIQERCEDYMNAALILIEQCRPLMDPIDAANVMTLYNLSVSMPT